MARTGLVRPSAALTSPTSPGRAEALLTLVRIGVLLFSAAALTLREDPAPSGYALAHVVLAAAAALTVVPLTRLPSVRWARYAAAAWTAVDVAAVAAYAVAADSRPGVNSLYLVFVCLVGPVRWGLLGTALTALPIGLVSMLWPMPDAAGDYAAGFQLWLLLLLLTSPAAAVGALWRRSAARLRQAQEQFRTAFEHASIGMVLLDAARTVLQANPAVGSLLGTCVVGLRGTDLGDWVVEEDRWALVEALRALVDGSPGIRVEVRLLRADGELRWGLVAASWLAGAPGVPPRIILQIENVTDRKTAEFRLSHMAEHDQLTGLPNRVHLLAQLEASLHAREGVCLLFLDLDRFKVVNDGLGHAAGDRLLTEAAARMTSVMRPGDLVARIGGDEFVVLCHGVHSEAEALTVAQRVLSGLAPPVQLDARSQVVVSASVGIALAGPGSTPEALIRDADTAMYDAKAGGGSRARIFTRELHAAALRTHDLEVALRGALQEDLLELAYQPIVDVSTGRVVELEALLRCAYDLDGPVAAQEFIAVAEQSSLIAELGLWVLDRALRDAGRWPRSPRGELPGVAVNVSPRQLLDPAFPAAVAGMLGTHAVAPGRLCLEVTETALAPDAADLVPVLGRLRELGIRLAIDDFGTGHASLTYLAQLPVDVVKVDRSFVSGVAEDAGSAAIVGGVVAMARAFGLLVVAEGVETAEQLQRLRRLGADRAQGYLLARPMADAAVHQVLAAAPQPQPQAVPAPRAEGVLASDLPADGDVARRFRVLLDVARDVTGCVAVHEVLDVSFRALRKLVTFTGGSIQLVDGDVVRLAATDPPATPEALRASVPVGSGISGGIAASGEPRYLPDITIATAVTPGRRTTSSSAGVRSWYGVPLVAEGRVIGVLQVDSTQVDAFDDSDRLLVLSFASVVATAVQTSRLFAQELGALHRPA